MDMSVLSEGGESFQKKLQGDEPAEMENPPLPTEPTISPQASTPVSQSTPVFTPGSLPIPSQPEFSHVSIVEYYFFPPNVFFLKQLYWGMEKATATHSSALAWKIPWTEEPGRLQSMGLLRVGHDWATSLSLFTFMHWEKEMAPHSSTLAWRIPGTGEPGGLQSMGSLRVRHDWATSLSLFTFMHWRRKWQPTPVFLPGESQRGGSLVGCHLWGRTESGTTEVT